jgi:aerobic-type carbon monoxide dehydrogenase small subunit (CoxS/CutS family)
MPATIELMMNGGKHVVEAEPERSLLSLLRNELALTGAKYGCGEGECGACTVALDGRAVRSCVTTLAECAGKQVTTIEGLQRDGGLHPLQQAFLDADALQCGYCTPGMIMNAVILLETKSNPTREEIFQAMQGNICRCCTYPRILQAIQSAAGAVREAAQ